jgi:hypothetical protein
MGARRDLTHRPKRARSLNRSSDHPGGCDFDGREPDPLVVLFAGSHVVLEDAEERRDFLGSRVRAVVECQPLVDIPDNAIPHEPHCSPGLSGASLRCSGRRRLV